jgi:hypothetical protein
MIQGQAMNIASSNGSNRAQWSPAPRGTIISVLERARAQDRSMSNTANSTATTEASDISLGNLAKRVDQNRKKNETYELPSPEPVLSLNLPSEIQAKPIISDLVVEDFDSTLTSELKQTEQKDKKK